MSSREEERENLRRELQKARDQLEELVVLQARPLSRSSRPSSHVSLSDCETTIVSEQSEVAQGIPLPDENVSLIQTQSTVFLWQG